MHINLKNISQMIKKCVALGLGVMVATAAMTGGNNNTEVQAAENVVVVIDPGHGGENLGTDYLPIAEKMYTLTIANYMKQELETYDNVTVYMTRTDDIGLSLEDRAQFAQNVQADLLCSLHLNQSVSHILYGAEVWIPSKGALYSQSYSFANEMMMQFTNMGLFNRGIKTKVNNRNTDYYGIIRGCTERNIPSAIIEHCHVDHPLDAQYYSNADYLKALGVADATAVARYFGLKSSKTGKDFSQYAPLAIPVPTGTVYQDTTAPEVASIALRSVNSSDSTAVITLTAADSNGKIQSYRYSTDQGATWSMLIPWNSNTQTMDIPVQLTGTTNQVVVQAFNQYDKCTTSNVITITK